MIQYRLVKLVETWGIAKHLAELITALTDLPTAPDLTGITRHFPQPRP